MPHPTPLHLSAVGATTLRSEGPCDAPLHIAEGVISDRPGRAVDLSGFLILPGIVDIHGDGFERHLAPRRGAATDPLQGLRSVEAELASNGITTAVLAQFWSWEGGMRGPDFAKMLCAALDKLKARTDLRLQLRLEIGCHEEFEAAEALIEAHSIPYVVFNDHLPHTELANDRRVPRLEGQALKARRNPAAHLALLKKMHAEIEIAHAKLPALCARLTSKGVQLGSHDDVLARQRVQWRAMGVGISEFPMTYEAAETAHSGGDGVILGAPNVIRGGSHKKGGMAADDVLNAGWCDALASDYHYPAPFAAARRLVSEGWPLERAWALVSSGPARLLGLDDRGRLERGTRADFIVTDPDLIEVHATVAGGVVTHAAGEIIERLMA